jgi:hypothetical protein
MQGPFRRLTALEASRGDVSTEGEANRAKQAAATAADRSVTEKQDEDEVDENGEKLSKEWGRDGEVVASDAGGVGDTLTASLSVES